MADAPDQERVYSVLELTLLVKNVLEGSFPGLWVRGEISNFRRADSGHLYFNLKEGKEAVLSCAMWRGAARGLGFEPADGAEVEAFGGIDVYAPRGSYQLIVRELRPAGLGRLLLELEELKRRLAAEGLFDEARKRPLPRFPERVGVVTSPTGAAIRDIVQVLRARWPSVGIVLAPVRVQGEGAAAEIAEAIARFNRLGGVDVLIVGRGGGSIEDLWAFNEEPVVRAIAASAIPVVSAVGHEIDTTLADFAADRRAATPSNAAELVVPERAEVRRRVEALGARLGRAARERLGRLRQRFAAILAHYGFKRQRDVLDMHRQRVDDALERMRHALRGVLAARRDRLAAAASRYGLREYRRGVAARRAAVRALDGRLGGAAVAALHARRTRLHGIVARLAALSPRAVLERGYCLARRPDGTLLRAAESVAVGELLVLEFARGEAEARVETVRPGGRDAGQEER
jgi:exodeoxyribonuclease VII large subunit